MGKFFKATDAIILHGVKEDHLDLLGKIMKEWRSKVSSIIIVRPNSHNPNSHLKLSQDMKIKGSFATGRVDMVLRLLRVFI